MIQNNCICMKMWFYYFWWLVLRYSRSGVQIKLPSQFYKLFPNINLDGETWFGRGFYLDSSMLFLNSPTNSNIFLRYNVLFSCFFFRVFICMKDYCIWSTRFNTTTKIWREIQTIAFHDSSRPSIYSICHIVLFTNLIRYYLRLYHIANIVLRMYDCQVISILSSMKVRTPHIHYINIYFVSQEEKES